MQCSPSLAVYVELLDALLDRALWRDGCTTAAVDMAMNVRQIVG